MQFPKNLSAQPKLVTGYHAMVCHILEVGIGIKRYWPMLWNSVFLLGPLLSTGMLSRDDISLDEVLR